MSNVVIQLLHSIKYSIDVPFANMAMLGNSSNNLTLPSGISASEITFNKKVIYHHCMNVKHFRLFLIRISNQLFMCVYATNQQYFSSLFTIHSSKERMIIINFVNHLKNVILSFIIKERPIGLINIFHKRLKLVQLIRKNPPTLIWQHYASRTKPKNDNMVKKKIVVI